MQRKFSFTGGVIALTAALVFSGCQQAAQPQKAPEEVVKDGMKKLTEVTSHQFEFELTGDLTGPQGEKPEKVKFTLALSGGADMKDNKDPKINLKLSGSGNADADTFDGAAELRLNKEAVFFTLAKLNVKGTEEQLPQEFLDMYVGKWWKITLPPEALDELTASLPEGGSQENLTPEQKQMKELFENTQFFKNIKFVGVESVKGEQSFHYSAELDKEAFMAFAIKASEQQGETMSESDKEEMRKGMEMFDFSGNVWVGQTSGVLNQVSGDIKLKPASTDEPSGTISVRLTLWDFNKPVTVQVPSDAEEFPIEQLLGGMMGGAAMSGGLDMSTTGGDSMDGVNFEIPEDATSGTTDEQKAEFEKAMAEMQAGGMVPSN
jgi:hypothetical protein